MSKGYNHLDKKACIILRRRSNELKRRIEDKTRSEKSLAYDRAEYSAIVRVLNILSLVFGEEV